MYNRYIPQPDGSYRRRRVQEPGQRSEPPRQNTPKPVHKMEEAPSPPPCPEEKEAPSKETHSQPQYAQPSYRKEGSALGFFKQLLPKDFDTGDLLIVLLLLLMAGDCAEDQNTALLTLALYFFM